MKPTYNSRRFCLALFATIGLGIAGNLHADTIFTYQGELNENGNLRHDVGMIAEDVGKILPEIVQYEANGVNAIGMDYSKLTPLLVEAVKTLRAEKDLQIESLRAEKNLQIESLRAEKDLQIESQSCRINQLSEENNKLNARLDALEELFSQIRSHL